MCARDEQTATERQVLMVYPLGKTKKILGLGCLPPLLYVRGLKRSDILQQRNTQDD